MSRRRKTRRGNGERRPTASARPVARRNIRGGHRMRCPPRAGLRACERCRCITPTPSRANAVVKRRVFSHTVAGAAPALDDPVRTGFPFHPARRYGLAAGHLWRAQCSAGVRRGQAAGAYVGTRCLRAVRLIGLSQGQTNATSASSFQSVIPTNAGMTFLQIVNAVMQMQLRKSAAYFAQSESFLSAYQTARRAWSYAISAVRGSSCSI